MSHVYKALRQAELEKDRELVDGGAGLRPELFELADPETIPLQDVPVLKPLARAESRLVTIAEQNSLGAEKFRVLRTRLRYLQQKTEVKKVLITSGTPGEGKTMIASNLAVSLARNSSQKILLLEGDLRRPVLASQFGLQDLEGLNEWVQSNHALSRYVSRIEGLPLWFLPAGKPTEDPLRLLQSSRFSDALNQLASSFDWVVMDAPPLLPLADVHVLAVHADGVILVIRQGKTPKKALFKGLTGLQGAKVLGIVFNDVDIREHTYYEQYYADFNGSGKEGKGVGSEAWR